VVTLSELDQGGLERIAIAEAAKPPELSWRGAKEALDASGSLQAGARKPETLRLWFSQTPS
jgi:hypothetical protein